MCNRYEIRGSISQIRALANLLARELFTTPATGNLEPRDSVYPDQDAPILVSRPEGGLELRLARWGFPPITGKSDVITNIRNLKSKWWKDVNREWLTAPAYRCLVPFTAFAEPVRNSTWFYTPAAEVPCFAGIWRPWSGERLMATGKARRERVHRDDWHLYAFLTTEPNELVRPIHERAMPVILVDPAEQEEWLAGGEASLRLQRTLPDADLRVRTTVPTSEATRV
ncbi:MAG: SOS response-associated peptidase family protein [Rhodospirillaceae bacterium]|nr:SOS response-associated peptidase family protein [Rhodospirillaceae bacterium]